MLWRQRLNRQDLVLAKAIENFDFSSVIEFYKACEPHEQERLRCRKLRLKLVAGEWAVGTEAEEQMENLCRWLRFCEASGLRVENDIYEVVDDEVEEESGEEDSGGEDDVGAGDSGDEDGDEVDEGDDDQDEEDGVDEDDSDEEGGDEEDDADDDDPGEGDIDDRMFYEPGYTDLWYVKLILDGVPEELQETSVEWARIYRSVCMGACSLRVEEAETEEEALAMDWIACSHVAPSGGTSCRECHERATVDWEEERQQQLAEGAEGVS